MAEDVVAKGWGTPHPWAGSRLTAGFTLVFGPRDAPELEIVAGIVAASHAYASVVPAAAAE
jgi:phospholipase/carboxylesterase